MGARLAESTLIYSPKATAFLPGKQNTISFAFSLITINRHMNYYNPGEDRPPKWQVTYRRRLLLIGTAILITLLLALRLCS